MSKYNNNFETEGVGTVPDELVLVGNQDQQVTDAHSAAGSRGYKMRGSHGGCWMAIARFPASADLPFADQMVIRGAFKRGNGSEGYHSHSGRLKFSTSQSDVAETTSTLVIK